MKRPLLLLALLAPAPLGAQAIDTTLALRYRVAAVNARRIQPEAYWAAIAPFLRAGFTVDSIGTSSQGRPLRSIRFGTGPTKVLLWSQMHGDEATATLALADIIRYLAEARNDSLRQRLERSLTIVMIPMLNPDGAARWQRENAGGIDINRDARRLSTPEARALKTTFDRYKPSFGFNLHDQGARVRTGSPGEQVAIALLPPAIDSTGGYDSVRTRARKVTALLAERLSRDIPGRIAKYDDSFNPRAFGDLMQAWGMSTVLIESGALPGDPDKQRLRGINVVALLTALDAMATGVVDRVDPHAYETLPFNTSGAFDLIVRGAKIVLPGQAPYLADLAFNYDDAVARTGPRLREVGDLDQAVAFNVIDATGAFFHPSTGMLTTTPAGAYLRLGAPMEYDLRRGPEPTSPLVR
jgi:hypothetical protein